MASLNGRVNEKIGEKGLEDTLDLSAKTLTLPDKCINGDNFADFSILLNKDFGISNGDFAVIGENSKVILPSKSLSANCLKDFGIDETKLSGTLNLSSKTLTLPDGLIEGRNIDNIFDISNKSTVNLPPACITANNLSGTLNLSSKNITFPPNIGVSSLRLSEGNSGNGERDGVLRFRNGGNGEGSYVIQCNVNTSTAGMPGNNNFGHQGDLIFKRKTNADWDNGNLGDVLKLDYLGRAYFSSSVSATNYINTSDRRIKKEIQDLTESECIDMIDRLNPKKFKMKDDIDGKQKYGFIGQEYKEVLEDSVYLGEREIDGEKVTDFHSIDQNSLISILVKNIQYLNKTIKELKSTTSTT